MSTPELFGRGAMVSRPGSKQGANSRLWPSKDSLGDVAVDPSGQPGRRAGIPLGQVKGRKEPKVTWRGDAECWEVSQGRPEVGRPRGPLFRSRGYFPEK